MTPRFNLVFYRTKSLFRSERFRWQLVDNSNGKVVGASSEGYTNKHDCINNSNLVITAGTDTSSVSKINYIYAW